MSADNLRYETHGSVVVITIDRPASANALDPTLMRELMSAAIRCDEDPGVRAVVLTGTGRYFSAGGDLAAFAGAGDEVGALVKEMTTYFHAAISRFSRMDAPLVAAVNGSAAGAGLALAAASDLVIASDEAVFTCAYTAAALTPDGSSTYFLPRLVGMRRAMELMLTNRRLSAAEALEWGLVNQVVPAAEVLDTAVALAERLAEGGTLAFGAVKRMLHESFAGTLETQMETEARIIAEMARTRDGREGVKAFLEKRKPEFEAR